MILVTGANGQLGQCLKTVLLQDNIVFLDKVACDISNLDELSFIVRKYRPNVIINCAAYTQVDKCEQESKLAGQINSIGAKNLAILSKKFSFTLIHISTDYVFDGKKNTPYSEAEQPCPTSIYGNSKLKGEEEIRVNTKNYIIIRTSWLYSEFSFNFIKNIKNLMEKRSSLGIVFDQVGSPTYAIDLANAINHIISTDKLSNTGTYHFSNLGISSWYDLAIEVKNYFSLNCNISPIETFEYPTPAMRPHYSVLNTKKFQEVFNYNIPHWRASLNICLQKL